MTEHPAFSQKLEERYQEIAQQLIQTGFKPEAVEGAVNAVSIDWAQRQAMKAVFSCEKCKLNCQYKVPGTGPSDSPIMIVGEGPGKDELYMRIPFAGAAGSALTIMLNALGISRHRVYLTNATHCNIIDANGKLQTPGEAEITNCLEHLLAEIQIIQPKVIIALGNPAMHALTFQFDGKMTNERGVWKTVHPDFGTAKLMCTWHPSYLIRQKGPDFEKVKKEMWSDLWTAFETVKEMAPGYDFKKKPLFI